MNSTGGRRPEAMGAVHGWMDEDEVRRLAESLMAPPAAPVSDAYGDGFVGFAEVGEEPAAQTWVTQTSAAPVAAAPAAEAPAAAAPVATPAPAAPAVQAAAGAAEALARASARARAAGLLGGEQAAQAVPAVAPVAQPAVAQPVTPVAQPASPLAAWRERVYAGFGGRGLVVIDAAGTVRLDEAAGKLGDFARGLARALLSQRAAGAPANPVRLRVAAEVLLEVVPTRHAVLAVEVASPLAGEAWTTLAAELDALL